MARLLGIDYGTVRVGLALSDPDQQLAFPKEVSSREDIFERVAELVISEEIEGIVVGLPVPLQGGKSKMTEEARAFTDMLITRVAIPVIMWPELLSSKEAMHAPGGKKNDASAAAIVLQSYIDEQSRKKRQEVEM